MSCIAATWLDAPSCASPGGADEPAAWGPNGRVAVGEDARTALGVDAGKVLGVGTVTVPDAGAGTGLNARGVMVPAGDGGGASLAAGAGAAANAGVLAVLSVAQRRHTPSHSGGTTGSQYRVFDGPVCRQAHPRGACVLYRLVGCRLQYCQRGLAGGRRYVLPQPGPSPEKSVGPEVPFIDGELMVGAVIGNLSCAGIAL